MIRIENDIYYMTAGEACLILKNDNGTLKNLYFGARIEAEDDLGVLGYGNGLSEACAIDGVEFVVADAEKLDERPSELSGIGGGKTLVVRLKAKAADITADIYYTPIARGGFSKSVVITNNSGALINANGCNITALGGCREVMWINAESKRAFGTCTPKARSARIMDNFAAAVLGGDAYGFMCVYGDGAVHADRKKNGVAEIAVFDDTAKIGDGETYVSPELIAVYSDNGESGMSRVLHDIIRGGMEWNNSVARPPIVLFCPELSESKLPKAATEASELGVDVFAVDVGAVSRKGVAETAAACRACGIKTGIKVSPRTIKKNGAVFIKSCKATGGDVYCAEIDEAICAAEFTSALSEIIAENEIDYLMIDLPRGGLGGLAKGVYRVAYSLAKKFPELFVEWGIVPPERRGARLLCYPTRLTRNVVEPTTGGTLKSAFDCATLGCLSYRLDPLSLGADIKRAVRAQIFSYQDDAPIVVNGDIYRSETSNCVCTACVTKDKSKAYAVCESDGKACRVQIYGLDAHNLYNVRELNKTFSGAALLRVGVPVPGGVSTYCLHIRQVADYD